MEYSVWFIVVSWQLDSERKRETDSSHMESPSKHCLRRASSFTVSVPGTIILGVSVRPDATSASQSDYQSELAMNPICALPAFLKLKNKAEVNS